MKVDLVVPGADSYELEALTLDLRDELLLLDLDFVEIPKAGQPPSGTKAGADLAVIGVLLLAVPNSAVLSASIEIIRSWISRSGDRKARLEIDGDVLDVQGLSSSEQKSLIEEWIARHDQSVN